VAAGAIATIRPAGELAPVDILLVTVGAAGMQHRFLEIACEMALATGKRRVLSEKGELRPGMVELGCGTRRLPGLQRMAGLTSRLESGAMGVFVASIATGEAKSSEFDERLARAWNARMAFLTHDLQVRCRKLELRPPVIELRCRFPFRLVVALLAIQRELPTVLISVAIHAVPGQSQIRALQVLYDNAAALRLWNVLREMTLAAVQPAVRPFEHVAGLAVIEFG
jgi:hypothetical protein